MDLFPKEKIHLQLPNAQLIYIPNFFYLAQADAYFKSLKESIAWQQDDITVFGTTYKQPRLTALYGNNGKPYSYSNISMTPNIFTEDLLHIKNAIESEIQHTFTTVLLNLYRNGNDSNGWHADNEKELGKNPVIASVSFGEMRPFYFKHRHIKEENHKLHLNHGSLLVMKGEMQHYWVHQIAKTKKKIGERINLTFRSL